jgi:type IV pilus assembly protein PilE
MCHSPVPDASRPADACRQTGFTLLELLVVVALLGVLVAVAYPHYRTALADARVTEGQAALMQLAGQLERCRTRSRSYHDCIDTPAFSDAGHYRITANLARSDYRLTATLDGDAVAGRCRVLSLEASGRSLPAECW